jgi:hypothetical protein
MAKACKTDLLDPEPTNIFYGVCSGGDLHTLQRLLLDPQAMRHLRYYIERNFCQDYPSFWLDTLVTCLAKQRGKTPAARERRTRMAHLMREKLMHLSDKEVSTQARALFEAFIDTDEEESEPYYEWPYADVVQQLFEWQIFSADDAQEASKFVARMLLKRQRKAAKAEAPPA